MAELADSLKTQKKKAEKCEAKLQVINRPFTYFPSPFFCQLEDAKIGISIPRSFIEKNNETVPRSLTVFARKRDLKISPTGAPWSRCPSNPCRWINKVTVEKTRRVEIFRDLIKYIFGKLKKSQGFSKTVSFANELRQEKTRRNRSKQQR